MSAIQALAAARAAGVRIRVDGESLIVKGALADIIDVLKQHKPEVIALLRNHEEAAEAFLAAIQTIWPEARVLTPEEQAEDAQFRQQLILLRAEKAKG
jgi:hypothetical protein